MEINKIYHEDCMNILKQLPDKCVDLILTSPPYDNLRTYNNTLEWSFEIFQNIAKELVRVLKDGGCIVWVVADATINGSETGTSFKQALYFKELGLNIHDTMLFKKKNYTPLTHNRYEQEFEYMFCFSKGRPKTFNPIKIKCKYGGTLSRGSSSYYKKNDGVLVKGGVKIIKETKIKGNIFEYIVGSLATGQYQHPAMFPIELANDQIVSWSNENDLVLDCFSGSGTTAIACSELKRNFICIEKDKQYYEMSVKRLEDYNKQLKLF